MSIILEQISRPNPFWFNQVKDGYHHSIVEVDGSILLEGEKLKFRDKATALPPGTPVRVWLAQWFFCESLDAYQQRVNQRKAEQAQHEEQQRILANLKRDQAIALNNSLKLPILWEPAIKDVLSGLSANSYGDGRSRATVQHIRLLEPLQVGRLKRDRGDFLCTSNAGSNGKSWTNQSSVTFSDGDNCSYPAPVSCKKCLELASRFAPGSAEK